jgi:hypothetical protein
MTSKERAMSETSRGGQSGGISNPGTINTGGGHVVGGNMTVTTNTTYSPKEVHNTWQPVAEAIRAAAPDKRAAAEAKLEDLKEEVAKGNKAEDSTVAKLVKGLVGLVPSAVSTIAGAFATPILSTVAGPVTKFVLDELGETEK